MLVQNKTIFHIKYPADFKAAEKFSLIFIKIRKGIDKKGKCYNQHYG